MFGSQHYYEYTSVQQMYKHEQINAVSTREVSETMCFGLVFYVLICVYACEPKYNEIINNLKFQSRNVSNTCDLPGTYLHMFTLSFVDH